MVDNVFNDISYRANINGMKSATTEEILHVVKSGIIPKLLKTVYFQILILFPTAIDFLVEFFCHQHLSIDQVRVFHYFPISHLGRDK